MAKRQNKRRAVPMGSDLHSPALGDQETVATEPIVVTTSVEAAEPSSPSERFVGSESPSAQEEEIKTLRAGLRPLTIYFNRCTPMPRRLRELQNLVLRPRDGPISPISAQISKVYDAELVLSEADTMINLEDFLGCLPYYAIGGGEQNITRTHHRLWTSQSVPGRESQAGFTPSEVASLRLPPNPKPDITYGFSQDAFSIEELTRFEGLSSLTQGIIGDADKPYFPFLLYEWKSEGGPASLGNLQAMRDGAAAVHTHWRFLTETGIANPAEHETAVFCVCVLPQTISIFISWRRPHAGEGVSWEMDRIFFGLLAVAEHVFTARSIVKNIFGWAQAQRLKHVKACLRPRKRGAEVEAKSPRKRRRQ